MQAPDIVQNALTLFDEIQGQTGAPGSHRRTLVHSKTIKRDPKPALNGEVLLSSPHPSQLTLWQRRAKNNYQN